MLHLRLFGTEIDVVDESGQDVLPHLRSLLPERVAGDSQEAVTAASVVRILDRGDDGLAAFDSSGVLARGRDAGELADRLRAWIEPTIAVSAANRVFVHAGAVAWRGRAIVIPGRSMTGKSTLVAALLARGATYLSDDYAVLDGDGMVHPYPRPISLRCANAGERRVSASSLGARTATGAVPVAVVLSTRFREGAAWQPSSVTGARVALALIDNAVAAREAPARVMAAAAAVARDAVLLCGERPDADEAAARLLAFVNDCSGLGPCPRPPRWVRFLDFLPPEDLARMLDFVREREESFELSGVEVDGRGAVEPDYRRSKTLFDLAPVWPLIEDRLLALLPLARQELGMDWFPVSHLERQLTVHRDGGFFCAHTDNGSPSTESRVMSVVFHFFHEPKRFSGGALSAFHACWDRGVEAGAANHERIEPVCNSIVFFRSSMWHAVEPVTCASDHIADGRYAVTIWVHGPRQSASHDVDAMTPARPDDEPTVDRPRLSA